MNKEFAGELSLALSSLLFAIVAILVKLVSGRFDGFFIALFRFVVGIILGIIFIILLKISFKVRDKKLWILRGIYGSIAMVLYYVAIQMTSSGRATLLNLTYPIFVAIFGYLFFKEKISRNNILSIILCIIGIFFVYYDQSSYSVLGNTLGLLSGIFSGMAVHYIKKSGEGNDPIMVYMSACVFGFFMCIFSVGQAASLNLSSFFILLALAAIVFGAQYLMTYGYQHVSSTKGSIISFLTVPLTLLLSYFFIGEVMNSKFLIGTGLIIAGLLLNKK